MWTDLESNLASVERGQQLIARAMTRRLMDIVWDRMKLLFHEVVLHGKEHAITVGRLLSLLVNLLKCSV
jgi:hypothetical protein